jgi:hypothetical protein
MTQTAKSLDIFEQVDAGANTTARIEIFDGLSNGSSAAERRIKIQLIPNGKNTPKAFVDEIPVSLASRAHDIQQRLRPIVERKTSNGFPDSDDDGGYAEISEPITQSFRLGAELRTDKTPVWFFEGGSGPTAVRFVEDWLYMRPVWSFLRKWRRIGDDA